LFLAKSVFSAIPEKSLRLTRILLKAAAIQEQTNALIEKQDQWGRTSLHLASRQGNAGALSCLVEAGANVSQRDKNQNTALHLAASLGSYSLVAYNYPSNFRVLLTNLFAYVHNQEVRRKQEVV